MRMSWICTDQIVNNEKIKYFISFEHIHLDIFRSYKNKFITITQINSKPNHSLASKISLKALARQLYSILSAKSMQQSKQIQT